MDFSSSQNGQTAEIVDLFADTFAAAEGEAEGQVIRALVTDLLQGTPDRDLFVFTVRDGDRLVGAALFSRLDYAEDVRHVFLLSPLAVVPDRQGQGVGQALLTYGLGELQRNAVDVAMTYGDPAFYGKVGFRPLTVADAAPPLPLSRPEGWIGQSLTDAPLAPLRGQATCVAALNNPSLW